MFLWMVNVHDWGIYGIETVKKHCCKGWGGQCGMPIPWTQCKTASNSIEHSEMHQRLWESCAELPLKKRFSILRKAGKSRKYHTLASTGFRWKLGTQNTKSFSYNWYGRREVTAAMSYTAEEMAMVQGAAIRIRGNLVRPSLYKVFLHPWNGNVCPAVGVHHWFIFYFALSRETTSMPERGS